MRLTSVVSLMQHVAHHGAIANPMNPYRHRMPLLRSSVLQAIVDTRPLFQAAAGHARAFLSDFAPKDLSSLLLCLSKSGYRDESFFALAADEVRACTHKNHPQTIQPTCPLHNLLSLARPCPLSRQIRRQVTAFTPSDTFRALSALVGVGYSGQRCVRALANSVRKGADASPPAELAETASLLYRLGLRDTSA